MHTEDPDARGSTTLASHPTGTTVAYRPRIGHPAAPSRQPRARQRFVASGTRTDNRRATLAALTVLYAVLAALLGVLVDVLEGPPAVVSAINRRHLLRRADRQRGQASRPQGSLTALSAWLR